MRRFNRIVTSMVTIGLLYVSNTTYSEEISLQQALLKTLEGNPQLKAYPYHIRSSEALKLQANITPSTRLELSADNVLGTGLYKDTDRAEYSLALSQVFELGGKREQRMAYADANIQQQIIEFENARLSALAETSQHYYRLLQQQALQQQLMQRIEFEKRALKTIERRNQAGAVNNADNSKMALRLMRSQTQFDKLKSEIVISKMQLANMWLGNSTEAIEIKMIGDLTNLPSLPIEAEIADLIRSKIETLPSYQTQLALQAINESQLRLMQANGSRDLTVSFGVRQFSATDDQAVISSISIPLAFSNPNRGRIAQAQINSELGYEQLAWQKHQLSFELIKTYQLIQLQKNQITTLESQLIPQAETLLGDVESAYKAGEYTVLQWIDAQSEYFQLQQQRYASYYQIHLNLLTLERITGMPMTSASQNKNS